MNSARIELWQFIVSHVLAGRNRGSGPINLWPKVCFENFYGLSSSGPMADWHTCLLNFGVLPSTRSQAVYHVWQSCVQSLGTSFPRSGKSLLDENRKRKMHEASQCADRFGPVSVFRMIYRFLCALLDFILFWLCFVLFYDSENGYWSIYDERIVAVFREMYCLLYK